MFFQPVKSSEIENETVNGEEAEAEAINTALKFAFFFWLGYVKLNI